MKITKAKLVALLTDKIATARANVEKRNIEQRTRQIKWAEEDVARSRKHLADAIKALAKAKKSKENAFTPDISHYDAMLRTLDLIEGDTVNVGQIPGLTRLLGGL